MVIFWLAAVIFFLVIEVVTVALVSIWFVGGALAALIAAMLHAPVVIQWVLFFGVSLLGLVLLRKFWSRKFNNGMIPTNLDRLQGECAVVEEEIDSVRGTGRVSIRGQSWAAKPEPGAEAVIPAGAYVKVLRIEGVKAVVQHLSETHCAPAFGATNLDKKDKGELP